MPGDGNSEHIIPSGNEVIEDFFDNISLIRDVEPAVAEALKELYRSDNISKESILRALQTLRERPSS